MRLRSTRRTKRHTTKTRTRTRSGLPPWIVGAFLAISLVQPVAEAPAAAADFKIIAYLPAWQGTVGELQLEKLSHVNYAFVVPSDSGDGSLQSLDNPSKLSQLVSAAHTRGVKVLISVGGWNDGNDTGFERLAAGSTARTTFVTTSSPWLTPTAWTEWTSTGNTRIPAPRQVITPR